MVESLMIATAVVAAFHLWIAAKVKNRQTKKAAVYCSFMYVYGAAVFALSTFMV